MVSLFSRTILTSSALSERCIFRNVKRADVLYHYTPTFSPESNGYRKSDQSVDLLRRKSIWVVPNSSSAYGISLDIQILNNILYEVYSNCMLQ
jgi:hypothetical protein